MDLEIFNETNDESLNEYENIYLDLLNKTLLETNFTSNVCMSVTFVDKNFIHDLNKTYRGIDRPTDVISFAFLDDDKERNIKGDFPLDLGEIYICIDVATENAMLYKNSIKRELSFLFVHGTLHLLGYDHMLEEDERVMFALQDKILGDK